MAQQALKLVAHQALKLMQFLRLWNGTVRKFNRWRYCLALCDEIFHYFSPLTNFYVTYSFAKLFKQCGCPSWSRNLLFSFLASIPDDHALSGPPVAPLPPPPALWPTEAGTEAVQPVSQPQAGLHCLHQLVVWPPALWFSGPPSRGATVLRHLPGGQVLFSLVHWKLNFFFMFVR